MLSVVNDKNEADSTRATAKGSGLVRAAVIGLAIAAGLVAWLATRDDDDASQPPATLETGARIVTVGELREAAVVLGQPIYWAGPMPGRELELKELDGDGVQVVYLPRGSAVDEESPESLVVGSYPLSDPSGALDEYARRPDSRVLHGAGGREVVASGSAPTSAYFAAPDNSVQVEVYDASPKRALTLALSGRVKPAD